jgi:hypothetical protein
MLKQIHVSLPIPDEEEKEADIDLDQFFEACLGMESAAVFLGDNGTDSRQPRYQGRRRGHDYDSKIIGVSFSH